MCNSEEGGGLKGGGAGRGGHGGKGGRGGREGEGGSAWGEGPVGDSNRNLQCRKDVNKEGFEKVRLIKTIHK